MRAVGERQYFTETEAISLSGLDASAVALCVSEGVVKPIRSMGAIEYVERDIVVLKAVKSMLLAKRTLAATHELRKRFGLPEWSSKPHQQGYVLTSAVNQAVEKLLHIDG